MIHNNDSKSTNKKKHGKRETTWAWGAENKSEYVIRELLEIGLNGHDIKFNASRFGIDQFEELI